MPPPTEAGEAATAPERSSAEALALGLYRGLSTLLAPALRARLAWRGRAEPGYRQALGERFGRYGEPPPAPGAVWLHAVSLGETRAAEPLIEALRAEDPALRLILSHGTATGRAAGAALLRPGDRQVWLPWDAPGPVRRFLAWARPRCGLLMETEVWPGLLAEAQAQGLPVWLLNARLSERSLRRGRRFDALLRPAHRALAGALAQTPEDAARLQAAGVRRVEVLGNLKFELRPEPALLARGRAWAAASRLPLLLFASSREGEEAALLAAWQARAASLAGRLRLLVVPRHPQRFDDVAALLAPLGPLSRRSAWGAEGLPPPEAAQAPVWLGDSLGEMAAYYSAAAAGGLALLGGSFAPLGGQNLIEAAACGCPLLMGPHTFNFAAAAESACAAGAAERLPDLPAALDRALALLDEPAAREARAVAGPPWVAGRQAIAQGMARRVLASPPGDKT